MKLLNRFEGLKSVFAFDNWPVLIIQRLFDRGAGFVIYRKRRFEILIDHRGGDENGTRECIVSDMYSRYLGSMNLAQPAAVLDLGANGGGFPLMLGIEGVRLAQAVCVEMNTLTCRRLEVNLAHNFGPSAVAINAAVCGMPVGSEIQMELTRGSTSTSIDSGQAKVGIPSVPIRTTSLQALYDAYFKGALIDICKIDIEGAEYEVFDSTDDSILQKIRYLLIEFHHPEKTPSLIERILRLGFSDITNTADCKTGANTEVRAFRRLAA
jgi:FkbM family methyltransferase